MQYIHHRPSKLPQAKILQLSLQCRQILHSSFFTLHFRFPQKKTDKLLYIDTSLDGILSARVSKLMTTDSPIQSGEITILTLSEYHTWADDGKLVMSSIIILPLLMNLFCHQLRDTVCSIRNWQSCLLLQFLSSTVWCDTRSKHNLLDIPLLSKSHHILSTTDIRLEILMIFMTRSTMNCSKIEDDIILCRSKWQVLDRLADIILDERGLQLLTITQSWLVILYYRIRSTRLNDIEVIYLALG